jgi:hypothetical protein
LPRLNCKLEIDIDNTKTVMPAGNDGTAFPEYPVYDTFLFGNDAFLFGSGVPNTPLNVTRYPLEGLYGTYHYRTNVIYIIHPRGYNFNMDTTPSYHDLIDRKNWTRTCDERPNIKLAVIRTNG